MKYKFQVEGRDSDIEITNTATFYSETTLRINNNDFNVSIADYNENEVKSFRVNERLYQVEIEKDSEGYPSGIYVNGEYYPASLLKIDKLFYFKEKPLKSPKSGIVKSFIPGSIKKIYYRVNDRVNEGDIVLILEAMKMENEIRSPRSGIIKAIGVKEDDNVLANHLLFEIE
jgi:biotin carboxyl carrier protein